MTYRRLILISFILNCFLATATKAISEFGMTRSIPMVLLVMYGLGTLLAFGAMTKKRIEAKSLWIGLMGGFGTAVGMGSNMTAASILPGYQVFPLVNGGTLLLVALAGRLVFRERIGPHGLAGIMAGIAAIILLST